MNKRVGNFEIEIWTGAPIWVHVRHNGQELKFASHELPDLAYAVECAERESQTTP